MFLPWSQFGIYPTTAKPDRAEVEAAVRTIIRWSGDNPHREGLIETPAGDTRI
jgi:GTP cyclohydrolase I